MSLFCAVLHVDCLLSACLFVKTIAKSWPSNTTVAHGLYGLDIVSHYIRNPRPGEGSLPDSHKNVWMLCSNGLDSLVFATKIIQQKNYLTRQMLGF